MLYKLKTIFPPFINRQVTVVPNATQATVNLNLDAISGYLLSNRM